jgi:hypothetical protein
VSVGGRAPARPRFLVTVDVEGDDLWSRPRTVTTENGRFLPRFQDLCERHGWPPTYLATFEMATSPRFRAFAADVLRRDAAEIGMHLHAWNSPPATPADDHRRQPRLTDYAEDVMRAKVAHLTRVLEEAFERPVRSHRGGRWGFDERYARVLADRGYRVDSSVTPHVSWRRRTSESFDLSAPDYTGFPEAAYFVDLDDVSREGASPLLEVPVTTCRIPLTDGPRGSGDAVPAVVRWLRPNGRNRKALLWVARRALAERRECLVLVLHSSELMPGGSPALPRTEDVEALYADLAALFGELAGSVVGRTLAQFHDERVGPAAPPPGARA